MRRLFAVLFIITITVSVFQNANAATAAVPGESEERVAEAKETIKQNPTQFAGYNRLAAALLWCALRTSDPSYYSQAQEAVNRSLQLAPNNFETEKIRVSILLGESKFKEALDAAILLNKKNPDDVMVYGLLTDANVELGNYQDAEKSAQWMLNLRPGNLPALIHAAQLRELFGDNDGSYELLVMAYQSLSPTDTDARASILTAMGHLRFASGNMEAAEKLLQQVLISFPDHVKALGILAQVRLAEKRYEESVELLRHRYQIAPRIENQFDLAEGLVAAGHREEADRVFADFETRATHSNEAHAANLDLVFYYADRAKQPAKALKIAQQEFSQRRDIYTLDAYAWALHNGGQEPEARKQIQTALSVGVRDAKLLYHAGEIFLTSGDRSAAESYLTQSAALNTIGSDQARKILAVSSHPGQ